MDKLPELAFEQVLSYLNLKDRLNSRAISRRWYHKINTFKVKTLCYSQRPIGRIYGKSRWVSGAFAENFISSTRFAPFFDTFGKTFLSSLQHLRLCDLDLKGKDRTAFIRTLNSFDQLEQLDIIRAFCNQLEFRLNLPMLTSFHLENVSGIENLTLEAPKLRDVKILNYDPLRVEIVPGESVERLLVDCRRCTGVKKLKNLKALYIGGDLREAEDPTFLSSLPQLKEIHLRNLILLELFERSGRVDLKIYFCGLLLNGPNDPAINALHDFFLDRESLAYLAENWSRLAYQIPFCYFLDHSDIVRVARGLEVDLLKRFTDLNEVEVSSPVKDIERFLNLLKNFPNIAELAFKGGQPQELFDRLPEYCAVQKLTLYSKLSDLTFLFRLKHLISLHIRMPIDRETVRRAFEELPALSAFVFRYDQKDASIRIDHPKQFRISVDQQMTTVADLNAAIKYIVEGAPFYLKIPVTLYFHFIIIFFVYILPLLL